VSGDATRALGYVAASLTTLSFVPQVARAWRSRSTHDLSGPWLAAFTMGISLWLVYGIAIGDRPVIAANAVTLLLTLTLVVLKIRYR
jgi:MtN3 and saliva related transmembrane protein